MPPTSDETPNAASTGNVLIVDDNVANVVAIEMALGALHGNIVRARSGSEALRALLDHDFALILLDVKMPTMGGFETAALIRARERSRHTPIIFMTAYERDDRDIIPAYQLGAVDFLFKPIVPELLLAKASVFIELHRRTVQVAAQAEQLRAHERFDHEKAIEQQRRIWEDEALRRQLDVMAQSEHRKDEFLAILGHELRNPLVPISTGLDLLRHSLGAHPDLPPTVAGTLDRMERQTRHLVRLVDDLLDLARINSGRIDLRKAPTTIQDVIEATVATVRPTIDEKKHALVLDMPAQPIIIDADAVRLTQVFTNILCNAATYTDDGGKLNVSCRAAQGWLEVRIADDGRGMDADLVPHVFDAFVEGHPRHGGLGLGLTVVKRLVALHEGTVSAFSAGPGQGSEFIVRLPLNAGATVEPAAAAATAPAPAATALRPPLVVALVEDNTDIREMMQELLTEWGHKVEAAADGESGVALILRLQPDIALVDIGLPHLDGYGVAAAVRAKLAGRPMRLVAMTGFGQASDRRRALAEGFDDHMVKPVTADALLRALAAATPGAAVVAA